MKKEELKNFFKVRGFSEDRWGHLKKGNRRIKMQKTSFRVEAKGEVSGDWIRTGGGYYKDYEINPETKKLRIKK